MSYKDSSLPVPERVEHLLKEMTLNEKIGQLLQPFGWKTYEKENGKVALSEDFQEQVRNGGIGSLYGVLRADPWTEVTLANGLSPEEGARAINDIQRYVIEN
jgi:beta-glucosidase